MNRRSFFKAGGLAAATAGLRAGVGGAYVPTHNWDRYDLGYGPTITDRLNQGPVMAEPGVSLDVHGPTDERLEALRDTPSGLAGLSSLSLDFDLWLTTT